LVIYDPCDKNSLLAARTLVVYNHVLQLSGDGSEDRVQVDRLDFIVDVDDGDVGLLASQGAVYRAIGNLSALRIIHPSLPLEGQHIGTNGRNRDIAVLQGGLIPQSAQLLEDIQVAQGDSALLLHVDGLVVSSHREPGDRGVGETGVLLVVPLEGRSLGISAEALELLLVGLAGLRVRPF